MARSDHQPRAEIVLVTRDGEIPLGRIDGATGCDLVLVDQILRIGLSATRLGCSIRLVHVDRDLRELVELVGLTDWLGL